MILISNKRTMKLLKGVCSSSGAGSRKDKPTSLLSAKASILIWSKSQKRVVSIKCSLPMRCHTVQLRRQRLKTKTLFFSLQTNQNVFIKLTGNTHIVLFIFVFYSDILIFSNSEKPSVPADLAGTLFLLQPLLKVYIIFSLPAVI